MNAAWKDEELRQAQELAAALQTAIENHGQQMKAEARLPMLNAVAGALVTVTGNMLASIEDAKLRKQLRHLMERELPRAIAQARVDGHVQVVRIGGLKH